MKLIFITSRSIPVDSFAQNHLKPQLTQCGDGHLSCLGTSSGLHGVSAL